MNHHQSAYWVERLGKARLLVVGDLMLDRFIYGSIARISPEAPVPVLRSESTRLALGGAGNVVRNLSALQCSTAFVSVAGRDWAAAQLKRLLGELEAVDWWIAAEPERPTTVKSRFIAERQQVLRVDSETCSELQDETQVKIMERIRMHLGDRQAVLLSDYGKGLLCEPLLRQVIDSARGQGCKVFVDPKGSDYRRYRGADLVTPNLKELAQASGRPVGNDGQVVAACRQLIESCQFEAVLATRGAEGMSLVESSGQVTHLKAEAREVFDVSGAGDTVIAVLAAAFAAGAPLADAAGLSNLAAGIVVGKVGTATVRKGDLLQGLHHRHLSTAEAKVLSGEQALEAVEAWRRQGCSIGFTNGFFDLLHPGHLSVLRRAGESCDRLIVGLNGDESVRLCKGADPVQNESTRSAILASLEVVDAVVVFQSKTPLPLLELLRPDFLIKGANYNADEVVGADSVKSWGGQVILVEVQDGPSPAIARLTEGIF